MQTAKHEAQRPEQPSRAAAAALACSGIEFFDVTLFAIYAVAIGHAFFPGAGPTSEILATVAVYGAGYIARPFGSLIIGSYGDRHGRRAALLLTAFLMVAATSIMALTPTFGQIGIISSIAVVIARLIQGFAFGGEVGPATATLYELAPRTRRNLYASWQPAVQGLATLLAGALGLALSASMSAASLLSWGWRIPFAIGSVVLLLALLLRRKMSETLPASEHRRKRNTRRETRSLVARHPKVIIAIVCQIAFGTIAIHVCTYMNIYILTALKMPIQVSFLCTGLVGISILLGSLAGGALADQFGARRVIYFSRGVLFVCAFPLFASAYDNVSGVMLLATVLPFVSMLSGGASFGLITGVLPASSRSTVLSTCYAFVVCVFGGPCHFLLTLMIENIGDALVPAYVMMVTSIAGTYGVRWLGGEKMQVGRASPAPLER